MLADPAFRERRLTILVSAEGDGAANARIESYMAAGFFVNRQYGELFYWLPGIAVALRRIQLSEMAERQVAAVPTSVQPWQVQPAPGRA